MNKVIQIADKNVELWPPSSAGLTEGWQMSDCGGWITGLFDSEQTCIKVFNFLCDTEGSWDKLAEMSERINSVDKENRLITSDDIDSTP